MVSLIKQFPRTAIALARRLQKANSGEEMTCHDVGWEVVIGNLIKGWISFNVRHGAHHDPFDWVAIP